MLFSLLELIQVVVLPNVGKVEDFIDRVPSLTSLHCIQNELPSRKRTTKLHFKNKEYNLIKLTASFNDTRSLILSSTLQLFCKVALFYYISEAIK